MKNRPPILITGSHRSGTTWVGKMLNLARGTLMVDEPFHINEGYETRHYALNGLARYWFTYARELPQKPTRKAYEKVLQKKTGKVFRRRDPKRYLPFLRTGRLIIKDPIAALSADWLYNNFDLKVMVLVRHPGAFVASLKRLNWTFPFSHFLEQKQLMEEQLKQFREDIIRHKNGDFIDQACVLWNCIYYVLHKYIERHPDWIVRTHEALSLDPVNEFKALYDFLNLVWDDETSSAIIDFTSPKNIVNPPDGEVHHLRRNSKENIDRWKNVLTKDEIEQILLATKDIRLNFYDK